jgi:hypothetical protein
MTDEDFSTSSYAIATLILAQAERRGLTSDEAVNLAIAALGQVMGQHLDAFGVVERLRSAADVFEAQCLGEMRP